MQPTASTAARTIAQLTSLRSEVTSLRSKVISLRGEITSLP
jgi:hypothetical protein